MSRLLRPAEVAEFLAVTDKSLAHWRSRNTGPPWIRVGRQIRYPADGLHTWLAENAEKRTR